jgi:hypothetical protein
MSRGRLYCAFALLATVLFAGVAFAAPPSNVQISESGGRITATWNEPGISDIPQTAEVARSPATAADGSFSAQGKIRQALEGYETSWISPVLSNGTWYVHISAYELSEKCDVDDDGNLRCPTAWSPTVTVRIGPGSGPSVSDTVTDFKTLRVAKRQRMSRLLVRASMAERGTISVRAKVSVPAAGRAAKVFKVKAVSAKAAANQTVTIRVKLSKELVKAAKRALARHKRVRASLTIVARDAAGNRKSAKRSVGLRG